MKKLLLPVMTLWILINISGVAYAQSTSQSQAINKPAAPQQQMRVVRGHTLTSHEMPAIQLKFDKKFKYVGSQSFILGDVARAEQHFFVDADKEGRVKRLYWVQFEGYLPSNTNTYRDQANKAIQIGVLNFIANALASKIKANPSRPGSDESHAQAFLQSKGYRLEGSEVLLQRLVHLVDASKRNELMIIYLEDLGGTGLTAADLAPNGRARERWEEIQKGLLKRVMEGLKISR
jgi:hypothetical protein